MVKKKGCICSLPVSIHSSFTVLNGKYLNLLSNLAYKATPSRFFVVNMEREEGLGGGGGGEGRGKGGEETLTGRLILVALAIHTILNRVRLFLNREY